MLSVGCYHWVPSSREDLRANALENADFHIRRGADLWRANHVRIDDQEIVFCDANMPVHKPCTETRLRLPVQITRQTLDVGTIVAVSILGTVLGAATILLAVAFTRGH
jgi:hypothetical protein